MPTADRDFFGCALIVFLHQRSRRGGAWAALDFAPWILVPWSWFHGGFAAGGALFVLIAVGEALNGQLRGRMMANLLLALGATAMNPYGFALWGKILEMLSSPLLRRFVSEWLSFWACDVGLYRGAILFFAASLVLAFAVDDERRANAVEWLLAAAGLAASVLSVRHLLLLAILAVPALAASFEKLRLRCVKTSAPNPVVLGVFVGSVLAVFAGLGVWVFYEVPVREGVPLGALVYGETGPGITYPKGAADFLNARGFSGRVWSDAHVGGYLVWHLKPACRIFLDGRIDLYPAAALTDYFAVMAAAPGWESILARHAPDLLLLPADVPLAAAAPASGAWHAVYRDPDYVALERGAPGAAPLASPRPPLPWLFP